MIYALYVALMIALPAALGAQMVSKNINLKDPTAGFMLLLLAAVPAFGYAYFFSGGLITSFRYDIAGPSAFAAGVVLGIGLGLLQRRAAARS